MAGSAPDSGSAQVADGQPQGKQTFAFIAMTCLFFFWGFITVLNDILIPFLKESFDLNYTQAMLVQFCFFGAYFIVSPFAGRLIDKVGYQQGIVIGLLTTAAGCCLFYPSASLHLYPLFLFGFFVLASGITILQVAANPYVAALGPEKTAASRLNLAQAANSFGTTVGPIVGAALILGVVAADASAVQGPYLMIAGLLIAAALVFRNIKLPVLTHMESEEKAEGSVWEHRHLVLGALAIFLYVGGEVSIGSFLVNYFSESTIGGLTTAEAGEMVAYYWGAAMIGRLIGAVLMNYIADTKYLAINAVIAIVMIVVSMNTSGSVAMWSILAVGFFNSIMFPTIFTLAVKGLGSMTSKGSGFVCQAIVGGALIPLVQGVAADTMGIQLSFIVPMLCYIYIGWYALNGAQKA
ncbi:glucose/galactose transporter family protein [gamma proteobacterium HTCC2207]|jgi:FHS family L-fucose permease-like MFS transporter|uniref:Glucose/galactose transporter family protein n=1 Tax=gamma proteobacterium HTCC2207 TaxID=314287 RepID=Q1YQN7_9GAMM|nr:glucose/galactose transporter family protein [gamma proteobacterium HTCC2207]MDB4427495.1 sugar MFS transporter [Porticoccaceae bacterium]MDC0588594.1 sugar MFS transporter [Porticoccaceae bacterium]MDG1080235.1 sugar MFS transporter [Porticoccaceae bacterium]